MRILGIDPGLNITGYGVIELKDKRVHLIEAGVIKTQVSSGIKNRLHKIHKGLSDLIREQKPQIMVLEKLYTHYRHPTTACLLGHVRGVICLLSAQENLDFFEYSPKRVRKSIVGQGNASKLQVRRMMEIFFRLKEDSLPLDTSDAKIMERAVSLYQELNLSHIPVLLDDRDERAGVKFKDADLLGINLQVVIGKESLKHNTLELKVRKTEEKIIDPQALILKKIKELVNG